MATTNVNDDNSIEGRKKSRKFGPGIRRTSPIVYRVTTGSLSNQTQQTYQCHINDFLAHFQITDITPLKEYSPKLIRQMVLDYVIYLRDVRKVSRSFIKVPMFGIVAILLYDKR